MSRETDFTVMAGKGGIVLNVGDLIVGRIFSVSITKSTSGLNDGSPKVIL
jgi:hypothetical protein